MTRPFDVLLKSIAVVLIFALATPSIAFASPKPRSPQEIHAKILKRGVGAWVCVEEANGLLLAGRVANIDVVSFGMQLENYPEVTTVNYADVVRLRNLGLSAKGAVILIGVTVGAAIATGLIMHHEYEQNKATFPTNPTVPARP
jgi:hypothetical protein